MLVMLLKRNVNISVKLISQKRQLTCTIFQDLEVEPSLKLQTQLKNASFAKILTNVINVPPMEKFAITEKRI